MEYFVCPGQAVGIRKFRDQILGDHLSMRTELVGDRLSRGTNQLGTNLGGPNVRGPYAFGTKCVTANIELGQVRLDSNV